MMDIEKIAAVCHEATRRYCIELGDPSYKSWEETPWSTRQAAIAGVVYAHESPEAPLGFIHEKWRQNRLSEGWRYGETFDGDAKLHPKMVPYEQLPPEHRVKEKLFRAIVKALTGGDTL